MNTKLKQIYSVFSPSPLGPDQVALYVDLEDVRGNTSSLQRLEQKIRLAKTPTCQVLTGHDGSGKTTELTRLSRALSEKKDGEARFFVVQFQAGEDMDVNDVDFPDVLIAIVRQVAEQLRTQTGIELKPGYFRDRWERLKNLALADISFDKLELAAGMGKLAATIKNSPEARKQVRAALDPDTNNWLQAANDVIGEAVLALKKKDYRDLIVIVDGFDKMTFRPHELEGWTTIDYLFIKRAVQLTGFRCHVIYTLPIELAYSHHEPAIKRLYGGHLPVVPMTKIATRPPKPKPFLPGIKKFREIISSRLQSIGATESDLFSSLKVRDDLIKFSGGQPTELMRLVSEAIVTDGLPIGPAGMKRCRREAEKSYARILRLEHWPLIEEVRRTGMIVRTDDKDVVFREALDSRAILLYVNEQEWYGLNPAVEKLTPPGAAGTAPEAS